MFINTITQAIAAIAHAIMSYNVERRTIKELNMLSDRDLSDIGICRHDIPEIAKYDVNKKLSDKNRLSVWYAENA